MKYVYNPEKKQHVCSKQFVFDIDEDDVIRNFSFTGGCPGNLAGIARLIVDMPVDEILRRLDNMPICSMSKVSSCPAQIRSALLAIKNKEITPEA